MYWEPTFYSALYTGLGFTFLSMMLYFAGIFDLRGTGAVRWVRKARVLRAPFREAGIILGLYSLWGLIGAYNLANYQGAVGRGEDIWRWERQSHLPSELWMQQPVLHHPLWAKTLNQYYIYGHINSVIILLLWLWFRHRDRYDRGRLILILFTLTSVVVQWIPVAPPRFLPYGVADVGRMFNQTVYQSVAKGSADQLAAMPSVHEGWSILVAVVVFVSTKSRWRWVVLLHPVFMMYVVVCTGNHYWADGIVAGALLALVMGVLWVYDLVLARAQRRPLTPLVGQRQPVGERESSEALPA